MLRRSTNRHHHLTNPDLPIIGIILKAHHTLLFLHIPALVYKESLASTLLRVLILVLAASLHQLVLPAKLTKYITALLMAILTNTFLLAQ
jgi:hypothetical protein